MFTRNTWESSDMPSSLSVAIAMTPTTKVACCILATSMFTILSRSESFNWKENAKASSSLLFPACSVYVEIDIDSDLRSHCFWIKPAMTSRLMNGLPLSNRKLMGGFAVLGPLPSLWKGDVLSESLLHETYVLLRTVPFLPDKKRDHRLNGGRQQTLTKWYYGAAASNLARLSAICWKHGKRHLQSLFVVPRGKEII